MAFQKLIYNTLTESEIVEKSLLFLDEIILRRTVRDFSNKPVPLKIIMNAVKAAASAPSGANKQPWQIQL